MSACGIKPAGTAHVVSSLHRQRKWMCSQHKLCHTIYESSALINKTKRVFQQTQVLFDAAEATLYGKPISQPRISQVGTYCMLQ